MFFNSIGEFFMMGQHGLYVWLSYAVFVGVCFYNIIHLVSLKRQARKKT